MRMDKRFYMIILFLICLLVLSGCMRQGRAAAYEPAVLDIENVIKEAVDISGMTAIDSGRLKKLYGIDSDELDGFFLYVSSSNLKASEIGVMKVKDSKAMEDIKKKIEDRVEKQAQSFKDYLPEEYGILEDYILTIKYSYILLAVSKDGEKIEAAFENSFK